MEFKGRRNGRMKDVFVEQPDHVLVDTLRQCLRVVEEREVTLPFDVGQLAVQCTPSFEMLSEVRHLRECLLPQGRQLARDMLEESTRALEIISSHQPIISQKE